MKHFSIAIQKFFFRGLQVLPPPEWVQQANRLGQVTHINFYRNNHLIKGMLISSSYDSDDAQLSPIVIFSHPLTRKAKFFFTETYRARTYLDRGYSVCTFDYNGFGESDPIDLFYWRDAAVVIDYITREFPGRPIILHGVSFGAFHILRNIDRLPLNSRVIIENVNKSLLSYWKRWPVTFISVILLQLFRVRSVKEMDVQSVIKNLRRDDLEFRFIACERDEMTTLSEMRELYELLTSAQKKFFVFQGARHLTAPTKDPNLYALALFGER